MNSKLSKGLTFYFFSYPESNQQYPTLVRNPELGNNGIGPVIHQTAAQPLQSFLETPKTFNESMHFGGNAAYYSSDTQDNNHLPGKKKI
jgi:hypothetical protein